MRSATPTATPTIKVPVLTKDIVAFKKLLVVPPANVVNNALETATLQSKLMQWGYMLSDKAFDAVAKADLKWIVEFHNTVLPYIKHITGGTRTFTPFYKGFPTQVMKLTDYEQMMHMVKNYWSTNEWTPDPDVTFEDEIAFEPITYKMINVTDEKGFDKIFTDLTKINTSLTPSDLETIKWFATSGRKLKFPDQIPFKENLCTLAALKLDVPVKTPTDVLRIAVGMSGGDISLPPVPNKTVRTRHRWTTTTSPNPEREKFKFKKFSKDESRYILALLEKTHCDVREMVLDRERWIRLGEIIHPGTYVARYPKAANAFTSLRKQRKAPHPKIVSWYGTLNAEFDKSLERGLKMLSQRPGEFTRRLDYLIRHNVKSDKNVMSILDHFVDASEKTSNKVLFEAFTHFEGRTQAQYGRSIFVKGARTRTPLPDLPALPADMVMCIQSSILVAVRKKFKNLPELGNVWIDPELKNIPLPTNMRSMSESQRPIIRGQHIPFDNTSTKVIRPYIHYAKPHRNTTIDLSVMFVGRDKSAALDWSRKTAGSHAFHSGDSYGRTGNVAEYVDIDVEKTLQAGYKYALVQILNYGTDVRISENISFGCMERETPDKNRTFDPATIQNAFILKCMGKVNVAVLDLENKSYVMIDEDVTSQGINNINYADFKSLTRYLEPPKLSVYDLLEWHVEERGIKVTLDDKVDTYFKAEDFTHSYEKIAEYMGV